MVTVTTTVLLARREMWGLSGSPQTKGSAQQQRVSLCSQGSYHFCFLTARKCHCRSLRGSSCFPSASIPDTGCLGWVEMTPAAVSQSFHPTPLRLCYPLGQCCSISQVCGVVGAPCWASHITLWDWTLGLAVGISKDFAPWLMVGKGNGHVRTSSLSL